MRELTGKPVADAINESLRADIASLKERGIVPTIAVVRVGARDDDLAYERGIKKKFGDMECEARIVELPEEASQEELDSTVEKLDNDPSVNGILMFRPLPKTLSEDRIKHSISAAKDVDCMGTAGLASVFACDGEGFAPCTAQAVIELLHHYDIPLKGKKITVIGRSLVIGKPVAVMLIKENATVTVCHTKTADLKAECLAADIIVAAAGAAKMVTAEYVRPGQIVIDVGMNTDQEGKLCGDVDFAAVSGIVDAATPVPRGVGSVTTSVLLKNTVINAVRMNA